MLVAADDLVVHRTAVAGSAVADCRMGHLLGKAVEAAGVQVVHQASIQRASNCRFATVEGGEGRRSGRRSGS